MASKLVDEFVTYGGHAPTTVTAHSPVDMVITDPSTGKRYVSSASLALPGDTVLSKDYLDYPDDISGTSPPPLTDPFPAYSLLLPDELYGKSLDLSVVGIGTGSYEIDYQSSDPNVLGSAATSGTISTGQTISGEFDVSVVPEPSTLALLSIGTLALVAYLRHRGIAKKAAGHGIEPQWQVHLSCYSSFPSVFRAPPPGVATVTKGRKLVKITRAAGSCFRRLFSFLPGC